MVSTNFVLNLKPGLLDGSQAELTGKLESNGKKKDKAEIGEMDANGSEPEDLCKSPLGPVKVTGGKLPWKTEFTDKGSGDLDKVEVEIESPSEHIKCAWEAKKIGFTFATSGDVKLVYEADTVKPVKGSSAACPTKAR